VSDSVSVKPTPADVLRAVREVAISELAAGRLSAFLGELERLRVEILLDAVTPASVRPEAAPGDRKDLLSAAQVAKRLGRSVWWVYSNKHSLPMVRLGTGGFKFDPARLDRWIARRSS
jgi:hypothetical protein